MRECVLVCWNGIQITMTRFILLSIHVLLLNAAFAAPPQPTEGSAWSVPVDAHHPKLFESLQTRGASDDELESVHGLHTTIRALRAKEEELARASGPAEDLPETHHQRKRDAMSALKEIMQKYGVIPSLDGKQRDERSKVDDDEGTIAKLRRRYLDSQSVDEKEALLREITQASAQRRLSMPAHGYKLHRPRPIPAVRDSEQLDYENSGLVHREEIRWIRERILQAETDEEKNRLRERLEAMMKHARTVRRKKLQEAAHEEGVINAATASGNGVPEPIPAKHRLQRSEPRKQQGATKQQ